MTFHPLTKVKEEAENDTLTSVDDLKILILNLDIKNVCVEICRELFFD